MDVHTFCPFTTHASPGPSARTARVASPARSDPAPGSLNSWHQISSPVHSGRIQRAFCSSVPKARMVGAAMPSPMPIRSGWLPGAPAAANSASTTACSARGRPRPPRPAG